MDFWTRTNDTYHISNGFETDQTLLYMQDAIAHIKKNILYQDLSLVKKKTLL